jgi:hypothetical protein
MEQPQSHGDGNAEVKLRTVKELSGMDAQKVEKFVAAELERGNFKLENVYIFGSRYASISFMYSFFIRLYGYWR